VVLKVQEELMKEQASAVKKRENELGMVIAQMQIDKAKPVFVCVYVDSFTINLLI